MSHCRPVGSTSPGELVDPYRFSRNLVLVIKQVLRGDATQAIFLWACATLRVPVGGACLAAMTAQAQNQLPHIEAKPMANMLWAFATFRRKPDAALLRSCEAHGARIAASFESQALVLAQIVCK